VREKHITHYLTRECLEPGADFKIFSYTHRAGGTPWHDHEFFELVYVTEGTGIHTTLRRKSRVRPGSVLCINRAEAHYYTPKTPLTVINVLFTKAFIVKELSLLPVHLRESTGISLFLSGAGGGFQFFQLCASDFVRLRRILDQVLIAYRERKKYSDEIVKIKFLELLTETHRMHESGKSRAGSRVSNRRNEWVDKAVAYMHENYKNKISLTQVAAVTPYHPAYFSALFRRQTGFSVVGYITEYRIHKVCELLANTQKSVLEIAGVAGFNTLSLFNRTFRAIAGTSPLNYRRRFLTGPSG